MMNIPQDGQSVSGQNGAMQQMGGASKLPQGEGSSKLSQDDGASGDDSYQEPEVSTESVDDSGNVTETVGQPSQQLQGSHQKMQGGVRQNDISQQLPRQMQPMSSGNQQPQSQDNALPPQTTAPISTASTGPASKNASGAPGVAPVAGKSSTGATPADASATIVPLKNCGMTDVKCMAENAVIKKISSMIPEDQKPMLQPIITQVLNSAQPQPAAAGAAAPVQVPAPAQ
jgi:hypothetical protein